MYNHVCIVEAQHTNAAQDLETVAIEAGAQNVEPESHDVPAGHIGARFFCDRTDLDAVSKFLSKAGWMVTAAEMGYIGKEAVEVLEGQRPEVIVFLTVFFNDAASTEIYPAMK